jgi:hypothetical protein
LTIDQLKAVTSSGWITEAGSEINPGSEIEDMLEALRQRFNRDRRIRGRIEPRGVLSLPFIDEVEFSARFPEFAAGELFILWQNSSSTVGTIKMPQALGDEEFSLGRVNTN